MASLPFRKAAANVLIAAGFVLALSLGAGTCPGNVGQVFSFGIDGDDDDSGTPGPGAAPASAPVTGSLVLAACDGDGTPILMVSTLAVHTRNMAADGRVSLLYESTAGLDDPLTGPRITVLGRVFADPSPGPLGRFLARHPSAAGYADFTDFGVYRVAVDRAHMVAGFGEIRWIAGVDMLFIGPIDLSGSIGKLGQFDDDAVIARQELVRRLDGIAEESSIDLWLRSSTRAGP